MCVGEDCRTKVQVSIVKLLMSVAFIASWCQPWILSMQEISCSRECDNGRPYIASNASLVLIQQQRVLLVGNEY